MRTFAHIIAESRQGCWSAWFRDNPDNICDGHNWQSAVAILIDVHGSPNLKWDGILAIEEATRENHAEFIVPYARTLNFPLAASLN